MAEAKPILLVATRIPKRYEDEFNDFYHHEYIPVILKVFPEILNARRYEEMNTGTLPSNYKQWLTVYQLQSEEAIEPLLKAMPERTGREKEKQRWKEFEQKMTEKKGGRIYTCRYQHPRMAEGSSFGSRYLFTVTLDIKENRLEDFNRWYEDEFLPSSLADAATWSACRRYTSYNGSPTRQITVFEAENASLLERSVMLMRSGWCVKENESWNQWNTGDDPVIIHEEAGACAPVFRYPD